MKGDGRTHGILTLVSTPCHFPLPFYIYTFLLFFLTCLPAPSTRVFILTRVFMFDTCLFVFRRVPLPFNVFSFLFASSSSVSSPPVDVFSCFSAAFLAFLTFLFIYIFYLLFRPSHDVGWWALGPLVSAGDTHFYFPRAISQRGVVGPWAPRFGGPYSFLFPSGHLTTWGGGPLGSSFRRATLVYFSPSGHLTMWDGRSLGPLV